MHSSRRNTKSLGDRINVNYKHPVSEVCELAAKHCLHANFTEVKTVGPIHDAKFIFRLTVGDFIVEAEGPTKMTAKMQAAQQVLPDLRLLPLPPVNESELYWKRKKKRAHFPQFKPDDHPVSCLDNLVKYWRGKPAQYSIVEMTETVPSIVHVQLTVADQTMMGAGYTKQDAKRNAAAKMLNSFGYSFLVFEPQENTAPVTLNSFSQVGERSKPLEDAEDDCPVPQQDKSEEEIKSSAVDMEQEPVAVIQEVTTVVTQDKQSETLQSDTPSVDPGDAVELLCPDVIPMVMAMGVLQNDNGTVKFREPSLQQQAKEAASDSEEAASETAPADFTVIEFSPEVQEPTSVSQQMPCETLQEDPIVVQDVTTENQQVSLDYTSTTQDDEPQTEEVQSPSVDSHLHLISMDDLVEITDGTNSTLETEEISEFTQDIPSPVVIHQQSPDVTQDTKSQVNANDEPSEEEVQAATVNLQVLPAEILSKLAFIGVIEENNGIIEWCEPKATTTHKEKSEDVICLSQTLPEEDQAMTTYASIKTTDGPENQRKVTPPEVSPPQEPEETSAVPQTRETIVGHMANAEQISAPKSNTLSEVQPAPCRRQRVPFILTQALVKNILKMDESKDDRYRMALELHTKIEQHLVVGDGEISFKKLEKIGKRAAKRLKVEYGSAGALLSAARAPDTRSFEAAVVTHLNSELRAFYHRPKSALSRFLFRLRRAFTFN